MRHKIQLCITIAFFLFQTSLANIYYVSTTGNDTSGDGTSAKPWRTLKYAVSRVPANQGHTIQIAAGTFIENGPVEIPTGVNIEGAGKNLTIIKAASSFYYYPASPGYATDKFLISLKAASPINGSQSLRNFTIDGDAKKLHGGIYVRYRNNVVIEGVSVQNTNFTGIWLWDVKDSRIRNTDLFNCSWGSTGYCVGALNLGNLERVEIDRLNVDESVGYGIKAIGPSGSNNLVELKIHDSRFSVHPYGLWNNGGAPNIAIELWSVNMVGCEIYNSYVDNTISLVNSNSPPATGIQTIRVHHNTLDMETRANGAGYGVELSVHDAEIDHNYFIKGKYGIAHWDNFVQNWDIHHNVFYGLGGVYPGDMVRSQRSGLHNVNFYNNTIEFSGDKTMNVMGVYGGTSQNVNLRNNLFINNNTAYSYYPNSLVHLENGAVLSNLSVKNNLFDRLAIGSVAGTYYGNLTGDPKITKTGARPNPFYMPADGSPLIDAGLNIVTEVIDPIYGAAPDIGAFEANSTVINNQLPVVQITAPANSSSFNAGSAITITVNASDADGTISKVEFFNGSTRLGEDLTSPYSFLWTNIPTGVHALTAKVSDDAGANATSSAISITVNSLPLPSPWRNADIGAVGATGSASFSNATFTLSASGYDIWDVADEFQFVYQTLHGNGSIIARVNSLSNTHGWAKAGVMIRESLNANSVHATSVITPSYGVSFQSRSATGDISAHTTLAGHAAPTWVKMERQGNTFTSSYSSDGITWTVIGAGVIPMGPDVYVGLCTTSHADGVVTTASFSDVHVALANADPIVVITSPANNTSLVTGTSVTITANASDSDGTISQVEFFQGGTLLGVDTSSPYTLEWTDTSAGAYWLTCKATDNTGASTTSPAVSVTVDDASLPLPWQNADIGAVGATGSASYSNGLFTVQASGLDIWHAADEFQFVYQSLSGNGSIIAKVNSLANTDGWAKAGVMIRESLNANSVHATSVITPAYGVSFQSRSATGGISAHTTLAGHTAPTWLKVERQENTFTSSYSYDGITWTVIGTGVIPMGPNVYIGLCVTSHADGVVTAASFDNVRVTGPLPSPWKNSDIGAVGAAGSASYEHGSFAVKGSGTDIWHDADEFHFVYQSLSGDGTIVAKVNSLANTHGWAKAGVMIRESLNANATHAASVITPSRGVSFQRRTLSGDISYHTTFGGHNAPVWLKIERSGDTFSSSYSSDGVVWTAIGKSVIKMVPDVYIGLCVTSHADGVISAASISDVRISGGSSSEKGEISNARTMQLNEPLPQEEEIAQRLEVFPNPVAGELQIAFTSATAQSAQVTIISTTSLAEKQIMVSLQAGLNRIKVNMDDAHPGLYIVSILPTDGKRSVTKILVAR